MYYNKPELPNKEFKTRQELYIGGSMYASELKEWIDKIPKDVTVIDFDNHDYYLYYYTATPNLKYDEEYTIYEQKLAAYNRHVEVEKEKKKAIENKLATLLIREPDIINLLLKKHGLA